MALNEAKSGNDNLNQQIFTFFVEDSMFGLNIENVLMLGQNVQDIKQLPIEKEGFCGVIKLHGVVVPVVDFAHRLGLASGIDFKSDLLEQLTQTEQSYISLINCLATEVEADKKRVVSNLIESNQWSEKGLTTRDETLKELYAVLESLTKDISKLICELDDLVVGDKQHQAIEKLNSISSTILPRITSIFTRIKEQITSSMRQVLLFITNDGITPYSAILIDEINDVISYKPANLQKSDVGPLSLINEINNAIDGVYIKEGVQDCLYLSVDKIINNHIATPVS